MNAPLLELHDVGMAYGPAQVLAGLSLRFDRPAMVTLAGPNGAGKSTLLEIVAGLRPGYTGVCSLFGRDLRRWRRGDLARRLALVPQNLQLDFPFTAAEVVYMGRTPHSNGFFESSRDRAAARRAMELTDMVGFAGRDFRSLSSGERQRVVLASALAQQPDILLLDEPTSFLDLAHQFSLYALLRRLAGEGLLVIAATHDLNLAADYSDRVVLLRQGRLAADGAPCDALSAARIAEVFHVDAAWITRPGGGAAILFRRMEPPGQEAPARPAPDSIPSPLVSNQASEDDSNIQHYMDSNAQAPDVSNKPAAGDETGGAAR
jgi:iron complex transport system ATP-binding protein